MATGYGEFIVGDGSGGGGAGGRYSGGAGGNGGGGVDLLSGSSYNDVIFGDGSGGGGGGGGSWYTSGTGGAGGAGGGGADTLYGGAGNDILFGDGFNGASGGDKIGGTGGLGGGGGGGTYMSKTIGAGGIGGGSGGDGTYGFRNPVRDSATAAKDGSGSYHSTGGGETFAYGGGGGGFGYAGSGGNAASGAGADGGTSVYSMADGGGTIYNSVLTQVTTGNIYNSTAGTTNGYGAGNDTLDGGAGSDHYFGMGGADTFVVSEQDNGASDIDTLWDFNRAEGDKIQLEDGGGNAFTDWATVSSLLSVGGSDTTLTLSDGSQLVIKGVADLTSADFNIACFLQGTLFETADGMKAIEELQRGDLLKSASGFQPLKWLARREVKWAMSIPRRAAPILIKAGALGHGLPLRDLYCSPGHAFEIDGLLVNAELLVNGTTIVQLLDYNRDFTWYNLELDDHALVYAEGAAVESYLEVGDNRRSYSNAAEFQALYPKHVPVAALALGRVTLQRQLPQAIIAKLAAVASELADTTQQVA